MKVTEDLLRYTYEVLKATCFHDIAVPRVRFEPRNLRIAWGYYYNEPKTIQIARSIREPQKLLMVMAHEMVHAALDRPDVLQHHEHDEHFQALAQVICQRMGWNPKEF